MISRQLKAVRQLVIALDRTQGQEHNVLMVSDLVQERAFPIFWTLLDKKGASNLAEQQQVLRPVIRLLKRYKLVIIGDREFYSIELAQWLHRQHLSFVFRQKGNTTFCEKKNFCSLDTIPVHPGIHLFYPKISLTQKKGFSRFNLVASGQRKYRGQQED
ncbi:transposase [Microcoleus vaginatus]|uniref:transposase n=1 Tax=Microcoleus vaginatus TaxID=119532 RepID=UPI0032A32335